LVKGYPFSQGRSKVSISEFYKRSGRESKSFGLTVPPLCARVSPRVSSEEAVMGYTIREGARLLGVSEKVIRGRVKRGEIEAHQEPFSGGFRYILDIEIPEKAREAPGEPQVIPQSYREMLESKDQEIARAMRLLSRRDKRISELEERGGGRN